MNIPWPRVTTLLEHGLNETEARAYLTLLEYPKLNAATLAKLADIPRSHLYTVLQGLQSRGLVETILEGKVRMFRAKPLASFLARSERDLEQRLRVLREQTATIADDFVPPPVDDTPDLETGHCQILQGRRAVAREIDDLLDRAARLVVLEGSVGGTGRLVRHAMQMLPIWQAKGVQLEVYVPEAAMAKEEGLDRIEEAFPGAVRSLESPRSVLTILVDDDTALFVHPIPDSPDLRAGRDFAILSTNRTFLASHRDLLRLAARVASQPAMEPSALARA